MEDLPPLPPLAGLSALIRVAHGWRAGRATPPDASWRLVTWWRGVLIEGNRPGLQAGVVQELPYQPGGPADAGPVVVPQR